MIKHIVMWKMKEFADGRSPAENIQMIQELIANLGAIIPQIKQIEVGVDFNRSPAAYDIALYSLFESKEDLQTYQKHPEHVKVAEFIGKVTTTRVVVDYEI
jgi:hypothetical protein